MVEDCKVWYPDFDDLPEEAQRVIKVNMMFNMGGPRLSKFKGMKREETQRLERMPQTRWLTATGIVEVTRKRDRLVERIRKLLQQIHSERVG